MSGEEEGMESDGNRENKEEVSTDACGPDADRQVQAFASLQELNRVIERLGVNNFPMNRLTENTSLENVYIGGNVVAESTVGSSQGQVELLLQDESLVPEQKYITCHLQGDLTRALPQTGCSGSKVYIHRGKVRIAMSEFSQELNMSVFVEGDEARVWVVNPNARRPDFLPSAGNQESKRVAKRRRKNKRLLMEERAREEAESRALLAARDRAKRPREETSTSGQQVSLSSEGGHQPSSSNAHVQESRNQNGLSSSESTHEEEPRRKIQKVEESTGRHYQYRKIGSLQPGEKKVNVFGVVSKFKEPFQTRGRDYCSFVTIVDDTSPIAGIKCTLFNQSLDKHPQIKELGDIVCIHRVNVHKRDETFFLEGAGFTSTMCFDGKLGAQLSPRTGSMSYTCGPVEKEIVRQLRVWALKQERASFSRRLESVVPNCNFDLGCQVAAVTDCRPQCEAVVLTVWDGTKLPLKTRQIDFGTLKSSINPHVLCAAGGLAEHVVIYKKASLEAAKLLHPGEIVQLQNLHCTILRLDSGASSSDPTVELCLSDDKPGRISTLSEQSPDYLEVKAEIERASGDKTLVGSCSTLSGVIATTTTNLDVHFVSLATIRSCTKAPVKFQCRTRILGVSPGIVEEIVRQRCSSCGNLLAIPSSTEITYCPKCKAPSLSYVFAFKLLLEDSSGHLTAYISDDDAIGLLGGLHPTNPNGDPDFRYKILEKLYFLTGGNNPFVSRISTPLPRPWLDCCLLSYSHTPHDTNIPQIFYRLFDTTCRTRDAEGLS